MHFKEVSLWIFRWKTLLRVLEIQIGKKSEKREGKTFELIQFPVAMKKVPQSWKASFHPVLFGNHSSTSFSKSTLIVSLRENGLRWQLDVSQPFVYFWLQSPQEGKQIYFLNIVWYAEYTDLFFLQSTCQICLPCEQCGGICWNSGERKKQADSENRFWRVEQQLNAGLPEARAAIFGAGR